MPRSVPPPSPTMPGHQPPSARGGTDLGFALLVGALAALVLLPGIARGTRSFLVWPDAREQTYAWAQKLAQAWHDRYLPLWDANTFGGHSFVGEFQTAVFYPLHWLWLLWFERDGALSRQALENFILLHFVLAAAGMTWLLRQWQLGRLASIAGAIVFALLGPVAMCAAAQPNIFYGLCLMPWAIGFASRFLDTGAKRWAAASGVTVALQILAGHVQPAFHTSLAIAALVFSHQRRARSLPWAVRVSPPSAAARG